MTDQQFQRNTAYKLRIGDILIGKPIINNERFNFLELGDKNIVRVNIVANVVDKFEATGEKKYSFVTIDDASGQIRIKAFGDDMDLLNNIVQGQTILIIGNLRHFANELYIAPEIVKQLEPQYLLVRKLEIDKQRNQNQQSQPIEKEKIIAVKDNILNLIKGSESEGGIDADQIIMKIRETSPEIINQEIHKLLEEGIIFEPRPGKLRYLG